MRVLGREMIKEECTVVVSSQICLIYNHHAPPSAHFGLFIADYSLPILPAPSSIAYYNAQVPTMPLTV